jgi:hypothetical protein
MAPIIRHTYQARIIFFFFENYTVQRRRPQHARTFNPWTHVRKPYFYEHLGRTEPTDLEIHKVTSGEQECHAKYKLAFGNIIWLLSD